MTHRQQIAEKNHTNWICLRSQCRQKQTGAASANPPRALLTPTIARKSPGRDKAKLIVAFRREQSEASALDDPKESDAMRTPNELKFQAKECLELADRTNDYYAKTVLIELAQRLNREARQAARRDRDLAFSRPRTNFARVPAGTRIYQS
jgi:hypothetical protein